MKVNRNIRFYEDNLGSFRFDFLNGSLAIPTDRVGMLCISSGCGSGKTTIIRQIIEQKYNEGIAIFCKTIDECNNMYDYVMANVVDDHVSGMPSIDMLKLRSNQVINLCSKPRLEKNPNDKYTCTNGVDLSWKNGLNKVSRKKVVIATHSVLLNTDPRVLTKLDCQYLFNINNSPNNEFTDVITQAYSGGIYSKLTRQFMLVDELPLQKPLQKWYEVTQILSLGLFEITPTVLPHPYDSDPSKVVTYDLITRSSNCTYGLFKYNYDKLKSMSPGMYSITGINSKDSELNRSREEMILSSLYLTGARKASLASKERTDKFIRTGVTEKSPLSIKVSYGLSTIYQSNCLATRFWIFDGTSDITMRNYPLYSYPDKYKGEFMDIIKIQSNLKSRSVDVDKMFSKRDNVIEGLEKNVRLLEDIIRCNNETLIIVWKNLKAKFLEGGESYKRNLSAFILNDEFSLVDYYKTSLEGRLAGTGCKFHVIHYQSGLDLATNQFMNCDSIVRLGLFTIPNSALIELNDDLGTDMDMNDFILYQNVQALSRTHIRQHQGKKIRFYITDDFEDHVNKLANYMINEGCSVRIFDSTKIDSLNKKSKENIWSLIDNYDRNILYSILTGVPYSFNITLDEIFNIIPMSEKKVKKYYFLTSSLQSLGITMSIDSIIGNNQFTI